jgi:hypothetical protein
MAVYTRLPFSSPVIGIGVEVMVTPETVDYGRMGPMPEYNSRSLMSAQFLMIENHHSILAISNRRKGWN